MNRLTITLDDDLYAMVRAHAVSRKLSLSKAVSDLLYRPALPPKKPAASIAIDPVTLLPVVESNGKPITMESIQQAIDDDDLRHIELLDRLAEEEKQKHLVGA